MDLLWHKVSEKEKEDIREQAKRIMLSFSKKLDKVRGELKDSEKSALSHGRGEGEGKSLTIDRKIMFENAPNKNNDSIIAEKGEW